MAPDQVLPLEVDDPRGLRDAVSDVWQDASLLFRQHAALASKEATERTAGVGVDVAGLVGGVVLLHAAALALVAAAGFALHQAGLSAWLACLVVAVVLAASGIGTALWAKGRLVRRATRPSETLVALGETHAWLGALLRGDR